jgi:2-oxoglutarate dehydrogenase E2 component (dihydrolipoamide succinyltransferase)
VAVNAPEAGTITELLAKEEDTVTVGQELAKIDPGAGGQGGKQEATEEPKDPASSEQKTSSQPEGQNEGTSKQPEKKEEPKQPEPRKEEKSSAPTPPPPQQKKPEPKKESKTEPPKEEKKLGGFGAREERRVCRSIPEL